MKLFSTKHKVRSYECDSYGHVNNAVYLNYLEFGRMEALWQLGFTLDSMKKYGYLVVVRRIEVDYLNPLFIGDEI
jgi:thioesterase-3